MTGPNGQPSGRVPPVQPGLMQVHRPGMARVKLCARIGSTGLISLALCADRSSRIFSADVVTDDRDEMVCGFFSSISATMRAAGSSDAVRTFEIGRAHV